MISTINFFGQIWLFMQQAVDRQKGGFDKMHLTAFSSLAFWNFHYRQEVEFYQRLAIPAHTVHPMPAYASQMVLGELYCN